MSLTANLTWPSIILPCGQLGSPIRFRASVAMLRRISLGPPASLRSIGAYSETLLRTISLCDDLPR